MLASLGHDDIQYWLMRTENRIRILESLKLADEIIIENDITRRETHQEWTIKTPYNPMIHIDLLDVIWFKKESGKVEWQPSVRLFLLWEIKPIIESLGEILRQLRRYELSIKEYFNASHERIVFFVIYNVSKIPDQVIKDYFLKENVYTYKVTSYECPRLEDL